LLCEVILRRRDDCVVTRDLASPARDVCRCVSVSREYGVWEVCRKTKEDAHVKTRRRQEDHAKKKKTQRKRRPREDEGKRQKRRKDERMKGRNV